MTGFEFRPEGSEASDGARQQLVWPLSAGKNERVQSSVGAYFQEVGGLPPVVLDLVRIAGAAYLADRSTSRGQLFSRTLALRVQVADPAPFVPVIDDVAGLLYWLTADVWDIELTSIRAQAPEIQTQSPSTVGRVALLSGGLDSFCGALLTRDAGDTLYLSHWDNPTVRHAQSMVETALGGTGGAWPGWSVRFARVGDKADASSRSRAFLFMALATAAAAAAGASVVEVPENGHTSLNVPLGPERGGALSTRSTHPTTLARFGAIVDGLGLGVQVRNPHEWKTKGELVAEAAGRSPAMFAPEAAQTLSCGKLDGGRYKSGNANLHCGLCVPCIGRRASFLAARVDDETVYLSETLTGASLEKLKGNRRSDVLAVRRAQMDDFDSDVIGEVGPFPDRYDYDRAIDLLRRGHEELRLVDLG